MESQTRATPQPRGKYLLEAPLRQAELSNGRYRVWLNSLGSGKSDCGDIAVTRWMPDGIAAADGFHIYLRDLDNSYFWSTGYHPTRVVAAEYDFQYSKAMAEITRSDYGIQSHLAVCVAPNADVELRRCRFTNLSDRRRRIELTSYLEFVLNGREIDAAHPAFSKLFVETEFRAEQQTIFAKRRSRSCNEPERWGFHSLVFENAGKDHSRLQFETNRLCFIGRGRNLAAPQMLVDNQALTGDSGPVLDPIGSLRIVIYLDPGETQDAVFLLGAAPSREEIEALVTTMADPYQVRMTYELAGMESISTNHEAITQDNPMDGRTDRFVIHRPHGSAGTKLAPGVSPRYRPASVELDGTDQAGGGEIEPLLFDNGYGGFSADGREYVIRMKSDGRGGHRRPPQPWTNVIANEFAGFLVTESGAGYSWVGNSRLNRLTGWYNDPVCDPHAEAIWIRDEDAEIFWSPMPGPTPAPSDYVIRHGFGYSHFEHASQGLWQQTTMFMAKSAPVKLTRLRLENFGTQARRLTLFSYVRWVLGDLPHKTAACITTSLDEERRALFATNPTRDYYGQHVAFSAICLDEKATPLAISYSGNRSAFVGDCVNLSVPAAITSSNSLDNRTGSGLDPCAAWQVSIELPPGGMFECTFLLGEASSREAARDLIDAYQSRAQIEQALDEVKAFWREMVSAIQIETPNREIDLLVNGWLTYQNISCRLWGRSGMYQPGGAIGFRDQLQDAAALINQRPDITREQILCHAAQQFVEGDVLHWWHPDTGYGLRTRFSDDLLWLPYITATYVHATGDVSALDASAPFIEARPLASGENEVYLLPKPSSTSATLYEHCCRSLDVSLTTGPHGLPLMGCGDWNDGMNRVGQRGRGESVWLGFFIRHVLDAMLPICRVRHDLARAESYTAHRDLLIESLNNAGWDGSWYRRAYYDNGRPLGSSTNSECRIDALAQAWAILSGTASKDRAEMAVRAVEEQLVDEQAGIIRLLTPPFDRTDDDPGYIKGYLPGIRENGGQYTHGVLWFVKALAEMKRGTRAVELLRMLSPISHTATPDQVEVYQTEPYVMAADVYGEPPHVGRGGWTWYTGSAGWMFRIAVESILGLSLEQGHTLVLSPCISSSWPSCRLIYRLPGNSACYEITIENPEGKESGVTWASVDDCDTSVTEGIARIPLHKDGQTHRVVLRL